MSEHTRARADTDSQRQFIDEQILGVGPRPALIKSLANAHKREEHLRHVNADLLVALKAEHDGRLRDRGYEIKEAHGHCVTCTAIAKAELPA